jgi:hypothetical protein
MESETRAGRISVDGASEDSAVTTVFRRISNTSPHPSSRDGADSRGSEEVFDEDMDAGLWETSERSDMMGM